MFEKSLQKYVFYIKLTMEEKQFLNEVLEELKQYQISSKNRKDIKQQLLEHIQESHEHGQDSINELGDTTTFVKDFLEINGIDLLSETNNQIFYDFLRFRS